jgi:MFS family permease
LFFLGPLEVLIPYVVKNKMGAGASGYGLILSAGGVGAIAVSVLFGQKGLPRRHITYMFVFWGIGVLLISSFAFWTELWQGMVASLFMSAMFSAGMIIWGSMMQRMVPSHLLGRVSSVDWLISSTFVPASFLLTGPAADAFGVETTLIWAGGIGAALTFIILLLPGIHDTEVDGSMDVPGPSTDPVPELAAISPIETLGAP